MRLRIDAKPQAAQNTLTSQLSAVGTTFTFLPADSGITKSFVVTPAGTSNVSSTGLKICFPWPNTSSNGSQSKPAERL